MATVAKPRPKTRIEELRELPVDLSVKGNPQEREENHLQTLEDWRPLREKAGE